MANEQKRPEVAAARHIWITRRQPFMANMLTRIGFIPTVLAVDSLGIPKVRDL